MSNEVYETCEGCDLGTTDVLSECSGCGWWMCYRCSVPRSHHGAAGREIWCRDCAANESFEAVQE